MSRAFRCRLVLMLLGEYGYGDHVRDDAAFIMRCERILGRRRLPRLLPPSP